MAKLLPRNPELALPEIILRPGCNRFGREGENDFLIPHPSVSRQHCEVWLTEEAVLIRDLNSRNGTYVDGAPVHEGQALSEQTLRLGDVEFQVAEAPVRISVPEIPLPESAPAPTFMPDGTPCCSRHAGIAARLQCTNCHNVFCTTCVRELRVAGGMPRRFCVDCGGQCELLPAPEKKKRANWLNKLVDVFTKPTIRN